MSYIEQIIIKNKFKKEPKISSIFVSPSPTSPSPTVVSRLLWLSNLFTGRSHPCSAATAAKNPPTFPQRQHVPYHDVKIKRQLIHMTFVIVPSQVPHVYMYRKNQVPHVHDEVTPPPTADSPPLPRPVCRCSPAGSFEAPPLLTLTVACPPIFVVNPLSFFSSVPPPE